MTAMAPVAEYRGVAIAERPGNQRAVWKGVDYHTNGHSWLIFRPGSDARFCELFSPEWVSESTHPDCICMIAQPDERTAKELLDAMANVGENPTSYFLSFPEIMALLGGPSGVNPPTRWDEQQGVFVR
jgi:hypothetical protein